MDKKLPSFITDNIVSLSGNMVSLSVRKNDNTASSWAPPGPSVQRVFLPQ